MNEHKEARQTRCTHESTALCLHEKGNDLQAGKGRSLQDSEEKKTLQGDGKRLRCPLSHFLSLSTTVFKPNSRSRPLYDTLANSSMYRWGSSIGGTFCKN